MYTALPHRIRLGTLAVVVIAVAAACAGGTGAGMARGGRLAADTSRAFTRAAPNAPPIAVLADSNDQPFYPDGMRSAELEGEVTAEFIVDSTGRLDITSISIVKSTDPRLSKSVTTWLVGRHFTPARRDGRAMAARTQQDFHFGLTRLKGNAGESGATRNLPGMGGTPLPNVIQSTIPRTPPGT